MYRAMQKKKAQKEREKLIPSSASINRVPNDTIEVSLSEGHPRLLSLIPVAPPHCIVICT